VVVAMTPRGGGGTYNLTTDYTSYAYDLKLLNGDTKGPFGWFPWTGGTTAKFEVASIDTTNPTMAAIGIPAPTRFAYGGGPFFTNLGAMNGLEVWGRAVMPAGTPAAAQTGNGEPSIIKFNYGSGKVMLFAYHPTMLINSSVDNVTISQYFYESSMTWDVG